MTVRIIEEGDKRKQGNAVCPQCGARALIDNHFGDPPKCSCGTIYKVQNPPVRFE